jgi:hypothetical protein
MEKTPHLNLIKPAPNTVNWGTALNDNFDKLDSRFAGLVNQVAGLRTQMGQLGLYYSDAQYTEYLTVVAEYESQISEYEAETAYITLADGSEQTIILYDKNKGFMNLGSLIDYSMFLIRVVQKNGAILNNVNVLWSNIFWSNDDIAVKLTKYDAATQQNKTELVKMPQSVGGYYQPINYTIQYGLPVLQHQKKNALDAASEYTGPALFVLPAGVSGNTVTFKYAQHKPGSASYEFISDTPAIQLPYPQVTTEAITITTPPYSHISTGIDIYDYLITNVQFKFNGQCIMLDYTVVEDEDFSSNANIFINQHNLPSTAIINVVVSYAPRNA